MAQFTIYASTDSGAPTLNGLTGSLLAVLDAILVTGYGTQPGAGWLKPIPNTGSFGCIQLPSGSTGHYLFIGDSGSNGQGGAEAYLQGWDSITNFNEFAVTGSNQFPTLAQLAIGRGSVIGRKSTAPTAVARSWIAFADSRSLYFNVLTADVANVYYSFMFGEFYSIKSGSVDTGRTMIVGRTTVSSSAAATEKLDTLGNGSLTTAIAGHFAAHAFGGGGSSITLNVHGDSVKAANSGFTLGGITYFNPVDNGLYISPIWVVDNATSNIRGRMRGFHHFLHAISNVIDGQTFTGSADYPGRTFQVVKTTGNNGVYFMETSDTLETN
jgi:hypothetical protein